MANDHLDEFSTLIGLIRQLEENPENLNALSECNKTLIECIIRSETQISQFRNEQKTLSQELRAHRPSRSSSNKLREEIERLHTCIESEKSNIFMWKSFGDAIAHIYLDRFSLKQTFFDLDSYSVKQDAGNISGKEGLDKELEGFDRLIDAGIPAVLCDATHVLRYGDICLLHGSDPQLIEVKSKEKLNRRGHRQVERLQRLDEFLSTDQMDGLRGSRGTTYREEVGVEERFNLDALNECIREAEMRGQAFSDPEPGVRFIVFYGSSGKNIEEVFADFTPSMVFMLNSNKNEREWAPYAPALLSIRDPRHAFAFYEGELFIIVMLDLNPLVDSLRIDDWDVLETEHEDYAIECMHKPSRMITRIARQFIARVGFEFLSLEWMAEVNCLSGGLTAKVTKIAEAETDDKDHPEIDHEEMLKDLLGEDHPWIVSK